MSRYMLIFVLLLSSAQAAQEPGITRAIGVMPVEPLSVEITTHLGDAQRFQTGDELTFLVNLNKKAYLTIVFQDAGGALIQILPNRKATSNLYDPGWYFAVPNARDPFMYRVAAPYGNEYVYVFASDKPLPELAGAETGGGLRLLQGDVAAIESKLVAYAAASGAELSRYRTHMVTAP